MIQVSVKYQKRALKMSTYRTAQCEMMFDAVIRAGHRGVTRLEFAKLLGIKKGKHLNDLAKELTTRDLAFVKLVTDQHNRRVFVYYDIALKDIHIPLMPE